MLFKFRMLTKTMRGLTDVQQLTNLVILHKLVYLLQGVSSMLESHIGKKYFILLNFTSIDYYINSNNCISKHFSFLGATVITNPPSDQTVNDSSTVTFHCEAVTDEEEEAHLEIYWLKDGQEIHYESEPTISLNLRVCCLNFTCKIYEMKCFVNVFPELLLSKSSYFTRPNLATGSLGRQYR